MIPLQVPDSAIRDAAAAVFSQPEYNRTSLLMRALMWLADLLQAVLARLGPERTPGWLYWTIVAVAGLLLLILVLRVFIGATLPRRVLAGAVVQGTRRSGEDAWARARELASRGEYTAAAHALYAGLLRRIAGNGEIELHDSKTAGDYTRELRARSSGRVPGFREFVRAYETVIYRLGTCDRSTYERLAGLARAVLEPGG